MSHASTPSFSVRASWMPAWQLMEVLLLSFPMQWRSCLNWNLEFQTRLEKLKKQWPSPCLCSVKARKEAGLHAKCEAHGTLNIVCGAARRRRCVCDELMSDGGGGGDTAALHTSHRTRVRAVCSRLKGRGDGREGVSFSTLAEFLDGNTSVLPPRPWPRSPPHKNLVRPPFDWLSKPFGNTGAPSHTIRTRLRYVSFLNVAYWIWSLL